MSIKTRFLPAVSTLVAASFALTLSSAQALPSSPPKEEQPSPGRPITEGLTEHPSLDAAEDAADPGEAIAYSPMSGNAVVLEDEEVKATTRADATTLRYGFSVDCPGNGSEPNKVVDEFNAAYLGTTLLKCGSGKTGYEHISARHGHEWQDRLTAVGSTINWAQFMLWVSDQAFAKPYPGYPKERRDNNTLCYSVPVILRTTDGKVIQDFNPTVITGERSRNVITSYPTRWDRCGK